MTITRRHLVAAGTAGLAGTGIAAPALAQGALPSVKWRVASSFPKSLDTLYGGMTTVAREVSALTEGRFELQIFAAGELVPGLQVLDAVANGTVEAGHTAGFYYIGKNTALMFDTGVPFGLTARQQTAWWTFGNGRKLMEEVYSGFNILPIPAGNTGTQMSGWFRKEIRTPQDFNGIKMRVSGMAGRILQRLGVVPQVIAGGDIYPALERGTIDAVEWVGPYDDEKLGFHKVANFYYASGVMEPNAQLSMIINKTKFAELPPVYQAALRAACRVGEIEMLASYDAKNAQAVRRLVAAGAKLQFYSPEVVKALRTATEETLEEESKANPTFKAILDDWRRFRDEQHTWANINDALAERLIYSR